MSKIVTEYKGIKYSLQPHGIKSKIVYYFSSFVVAFGGALAAASPAIGAPGDMTCSVEVEPSPDPSDSPSESPSPSLSPTPCPTVPPPETETVFVAGPTKTVTRTVARTVFVTEEVTVVVEPTHSETVHTSEPSLMPTPDPVAQDSEEDGSSLAGWGLGVAVATGAALAAVGVAGVARSRRRQAGKHRVDNSATQIIPALADEDFQDMSDYGPAAAYDPALGGYAGESYQAGDTEPLPPVEETPNGS